MPLSTHMAERYRLHLIHLRTMAYRFLDGTELAEMNDGIEDLADTLMAGGPSVVQVEIAPLTPAAEVALGVEEAARALAEQHNWDDERLEAARHEQGIAALLDDSAPFTSSDRDHREQGAA